MKKNIIIGVLAVMTLSSWVYAFYWKINAEEQKALAIEQAKIADQAREVAHEQMKLAEEARAQSEMVILDLLQSKETE